MRNSVVERWEEIPGYEGMYEVSDLGRVKSVERMVRHHRSRTGFARRKERILQQTQRRGEYVMVGLFDGEGNQTKHSVHRLVMLAFNGPSDKTVHHKDYNPKNNALTNLTYMTSEANSMDAHRVGAQDYCRGENHGKASITEGLALRIKTMGSNGVPNSKIASSLNVSDSVVRHITSGRRWKHLKRLSELEEDPAKHD